MAKTKRKWIDLSWSSSDCLRLQDIPYDGSSNSKTKLDSAFNASNLSSGTIPNARLSGGTYSIASLTLSSPLAITSGGTGFSSAGSSDTIVGMNSAGNAFEYKAISGSSSGVQVTHTANSIALSIGSSYVGQTSITTLGTIATGTWDATAISVAKGGTGLSAVGTANQFLGTNAGATGFEHKTISGTSNRLSVTHGVGSVTLNIDTEYVGQTSITTLGTIATGTWSATAIAADKGGTGQTSYVVGDILFASGASALSKLAGVATGNVLLSAGVSTAPAWGQITGSHISTGSTIGVVALTLSGPTTGTTRVSLTAAEPTGGSTNLAAQFNGTTLFQKALSSSSSFVTVKGTGTGRAGIAVDGVDGSHFDFYTNGSIRWAFYQDGSNNLSYYSYTATAGNVFVLSGGTNKGGAVSSRFAVGTTTVPTSGAALQITGDATFSGSSATASRAAVGTATVPTSGATFQVTGSVSASGAAGFGGRVAIGSSTPPASGVELQVTGAASVSSDLTANTIQPVAASGYKASDGSPGWTGTFDVFDGAVTTKTITVKDGIITDVITIA